MPAKPGVPTSRPRGRVRRLGDRVLPRLARGVINLLWKTCRVDIDGSPALDALAADGKPVIPCYWHGQQIFCVHALLELRERQSNRLKLGYLISPSRDGDAAARMFSDLNLRVIRGSATRGGAQALREIYEAIRNEGVSPIVTPDGPRGPAEQFKSGVAMLASLSGAPLVPVAYAARPAVRLSSWDRTLLPLPFARVKVVVGEPITVARGLAGDALEDVCTDARGRMLQLEQLARDGLRG